MFYETCMLLNQSTTRPVSLNNYVGQSNFCDSLRTVRLRYINYITLPAYLFI